MGLAPILRTPILRVPTLRVPILHTPTLRARILRVPVLRTPTLRARILRVPVLRTPTLRVPTLRAPLLRARTLRVPILGVPILRVPTLRARILRVPLHTPILNGRPEASQAGARQPGAGQAGASQAGTGQPGAGQAKASQAGASPASTFSEAGLPLAGKRVLVTRTRDQAGALSERLRALGAHPVEFPTIRIVPPLDWSALDAALRRLYAAGTPEAERYDWLVLTSANGVHICMQRLNSLGCDPRALRPVRVAAIRPATAAALEHYGVSADLVPEEYIAEGIAAALIEHERQRGSPIAGQRILLARAAEARKVLVDLLRQAGALVDEVAAYSTLPAASDDEQGRELLRLLQCRQLDILTFTSSSTVRNFVAWLRSSQQGSGADLMAALSSIAIACIGPVTARTARELGLAVTIEAREFTIDGLVQAIVQAYEDRHD